MPANSSFDTMQTFILIKKHNSLSGSAIMFVGMKQIIPAFPICNAILDSNKNGQTAFLQLAHFY
jgi:hypothetical protein